MKATKRFFASCSLFASVFAIPVFAQDETDDLYFNSKDLKKKKEVAKIKAANPERTYYNYATPANSVPDTVERDERFDDPNYTNKYIEAERNEGQTVQNATTINNYYYNNNQSATSNSSSNQLGWYENNNYKLRRRARGSQWNINPSISWNNWSGTGFYMSGSWNSGWNNGYGWNSPYYNGWNNSYYGYGYGINSGFGGCWGWGDPYYNNYWGYNSGYNYGYNSWTGASYWGWNVYNPYVYGSYGYSPYGYANGFGYNPYYGWRPVVYVPVNTVSHTSQNVNYGPINRGTNVTNTNGYNSGNGNGTLVRPNSTDGFSQQRNQNGNQSQELVRPRERYVQPQQTSPIYTQPQQNTQPRNDTYSVPDGFRGYDNNRGGSDFGNGRSGGGFSPRSEQNSGGGGNSPSNGGGGLARPR